MDNMKQLKPLEPSSLRTLCGYFEQVHSSPAREIVAECENLLRSGDPHVNSIDPLYNELLTIAARKGLFESDGLKATQRALELMKGLPKGSLEHQTRSQLLELMLK